MNDLIDHKIEGEVIFEKIFMTSDLFVNSAKELNGIPES
jgi:hypothetical protein